MNGTGKWPILRRGDAGQLVRTIQYLLRDHGHSLDVDGTFGPQTEQRVRNFQRDKGLRIDGVVGDHTWPRLVVQIARGARRHAVHAAQTLLQLRGHVLPVDGAFGPETGNRVRSFQTDRGLAVDGIVGPATWYTLVTGYFVHFADAAAAARHLHDAWRDNHRPTALHNAATPAVHTLFEVAWQAARPGFTGCVPRDGGLDCTYHSALGDVVMRVKPEGALGFHVAAVDRRTPERPVTRIRLDGPFWIAEAEVVELADPKANLALRALFVDVNPRPALGQPAVLLPETLLVLCFITKVTITPSSGPQPGYVWQRIAGTRPQGNLSPTAIRDLLDAGQLALLLVQAGPDGWPQPNRLIASCLAGDISLDVLQPHNGADAAVYRGLALQQLGRETLATRTGAARLPGAVSVHASGMSLYGQAVLPWDERPVTGVFQLTRRQPDPIDPPSGQPTIGLQLTIETERLTDAEHDAVLDSWQRFTRYINPRHPLNRLISPPPVTSWITLEPANPLAIPQLHWEVLGWREQPGALPLRFAVGEVNLLLSDQQPYDLETPPTALARVVSTEVTVRRDGGLRVELHTGEPAGGPGAQLDYAATLVNGVWQERVTLRRATVAFDPTSTPRLLRAAQDLPAPEWEPAATAELTNPVTPPIVWGFMALEDGWAQLPVPNLTEQIYLDTQLADTDREPATTVLQGAVTFGNDQPAVLAAHPEEQPWNLTLLGARGVRGVWQLTHNGAGYVISRVTVTVLDPEAVLNGLVWFGLEPPTAGDALPSLDNWVTSLTDVPLRTVSGDEPLPPLIRLTLDALHFALRGPDAASQRSAALHTWAFEYQADQALLQQLGRQHVLPTGVFAAYLPLVWRRHPALPMIHTLPLTQTLSPPNYPSPSRQLAPFELATTADGLPTGWRFGITADKGANTWPRLLGPASPAREWKKPFDLPLAALSLPGLVLDPTPEGDPPATDPGTGLPIQYRFDLPYTDELQALAQLPAVTRDPAEPAPLPGQPRPAPPRPLTREAFAAHWQRLAERASLASADAVTVFSKGDVTALIEPATWPVRVTFDLDRYPGSLTLDNADAATSASLRLAEDTALRGIDGRFTDVGGRLRRLTGDVGSGYLVVAGAMAARREPDGAFRDQRGLARSATASDVALLRTKVTLLDGAAHELTTARRPIQLKAGDDGWQLWFRDLPAQDDGTFRRAEVWSSKAEDVNDPEARSRDYVHLQGYEWRLAAPEKARALPLFGLRCYPLTLETVGFHPDGVQRVEIIGRLQLPLTDEVEQVDVSNAIRLTFTGSGTSLTLSAVTSVSEPVEWPLALRDGEVVDAPRLRWTAISLADDHLKINDARLHFFLFGVDWQVGLPPLSFRSRPAGPIEHTVRLPQPTIQPPLAPDILRLVLDLASLAHAAELQVAVRLGSRPAAGGGSGRQSFAASVAFDLMTAHPDAPRWEHGRLFDDLPLQVGRDQGTPVALANDRSLQLAWRALDVTDVTQFQFLPGMPLADAAAPGFTALAFTAVPTPAGVPELRLDSAFVEVVLSCRWGEYLQADGPPTPMQVFSSSAGDLSIGYTGRWEQPTWAESFLLNGVLEVKNLFSASQPLALDQVRLTLPPARGVTTPLSHLRHTVRVLFNQHLVPAEALAAGTDQLLFTLAPGRSWQFLAVVEHQLLQIDPTDDLGTVQRSRSVRWTVVHEVRVLLPTTFRKFLQTLATARTVDPTGGISDLGSISSGYLDSGLRARLTAPGGELERLPDDMLLVEASAAHLVTRTPADAASPTALQYLPLGTQLALLSSPRDYAPSDPRDPRWLPLPLPFLGRLQNAARDGLGDDAPDGRDENPLQVDPLVILARRRAAAPGSALPDTALALATWADKAPVDVVLASTDTAVVRSLARLDPVALEESWFRLNHPQPEPEGELLHSVTAALPDTPARLSRPLALRRALDPRRLTYPPTDPGLALLPEPATTAQVVWREQGLLLTPGVTNHTTPYGWIVVAAQLAGGLLPRPGHDTRLVAATMMPALRQLDGMPKLHPQSLAVSPYLGLEWRPAPPASTLTAPPPLQLRVLLAELLCLDATTRSLRPIASHLWEVGEGEAPTIRATSLEWGLQTQRRLAPDAPIAVLRYRGMNDNTNPDSASEAPLTTSYSFALIPGAGTHSPLARRVFRMRAQPSKLRYREGQCGIATMPHDVRAVEVAPPQVTGVQPIHLTERPASWPWGLSALRVSVQYTEGKVGLAGRAGLDGGAGPTLWWQLVQHAVQYRSALHTKRPAAGLPPLFRAPPIKSLLPVLPAPPLPTIERALLTEPVLPSGHGEFPESLRTWQPLLPGALRYLVTGARPGVPFTIRHLLLRQGGLTFAGGGAPAAGVLVSGSVPAQHRMPRPVPLPINDHNRRDLALQPWASFFEPEVNHLATNGPADEAFLAQTVLEAGGQRQVKPPRRLQLTLISPAHGAINPRAAGALVFAVRLEDEPPPDGWAVIGMEIIDEGTMLHYDGPSTISAPGDYTFTPRASEQLQERLAAKPLGTVMLVRAHVRPQTSTDGFVQILTFPLRIIGDRATALPLQPRFIHFEDPEYNRHLASSSAHVTGIVQLPGKGETLVQRSITLAAERRECNPGSTLAIRYDWGDDPGVADDAVEQVTLALTRVDLDRIPRDLRLDSLPAPLPAGTLQQLALPELQQADGTRVRFSSGDILLLVLQLKIKNNPAVQEIVLAITIVEEPVVPTPENAYALLRAQEINGRHQVECVRFAWGPVPARVELVAPDDLRTEVVRRRSVFHLTDSVRPGTLKGYAIQKIAPTGATHFPKL